VSPPFHYRWEWLLRAAPAALWPLVADTNRFNRDTGIPAVTRVAEGPARPNARRRLRLSRFGLPVEWEEEPFEWVWPERFGVVRRYRTGPVAELRVLVELAPRPEGGTRLAYQVWARPRGLLGRLAIPVEVGRRCARAFEAAVREYDLRLAAGGDATLPPGGPAAALPAPAAARVAAARRVLAGQGVPAALVDRLVATVERADALALARLRPYVLADQWGVPRRQVLELCLRATRAGLLDLRWDLLCPLCRGPQAGQASLAGVTAAVHCDTCRIDFTVDFDRLVEVTFRPSPAVREVESREFCIGGPQVTPHVVVQQLLSPGARRAVSTALEPGRYRVRVLDGPGSRLLRVEPGGPAEAAILVDAGGWPPGELVVGSPALLRLESAAPDERLLILERLAWTDQAATAGDVTVLQVFRDLFATEALRPGERLAVGTLALAFTDLAGSTRLYREAGDAAAFGRVMDHFDVLREEVGREGGAVVKTMGDAVMAAFPRPAAALRAMLAAQRRLAEPAPGRPRLALKAGVHAGPCLAITQNARLDYFGTTVNLAARLEGYSSGGRDVVVSEAVRQDPEVTGWLAGAGAVLAAERFEAAPKGFEEERMAFWRIRRAAAGVDSPAGAS
jgi:class 3 adenylate cyclase